MITEREENQLENLQKEIRDLVFRYVREGGLNPLLIILAFSRELGRMAAANFTGAGNITVYLECVHSLVDDSFHTAFKKIKEGTH